MKITVFTSNQPRHIALLDALVAAGHEVRAVIEPKTYLRPPTTSFGRPTAETMATYWDRVRLAEGEVFPNGAIVKVPAFVLRPGELSGVRGGKRKWLEDSDRFVVFSSSYITGWLADFLVDRNTLNLHVGIAPEFRGSAPNFWAEYLGRPDLVGAQVQRLAKGLDSGEILAEVRPYSNDRWADDDRIVHDPFLRGMEACRLGIEAMVDMLGLMERCTRTKVWAPIRPNDRTQEIAYRRHEDFTEEVVAAYLRRLDGNA